jgi:hypothetical protein
MTDSENKELKALTQTISVLQTLDVEDRKRVFAATLVMLGMVDVDSIIGEWRSSEEPLDLEDTD